VTQHLDKCSIIAMDTSFTPEPSSLILLIDDDNFTRTQIRLFLEKENFQVVEASNGQEGLDAYQRLHPDLVLLDAVMPIMDGFECCTRMRSLPRSNHTPTLIITGLEDQKSVDRAFAAGAADYVTKPIHWAVLRQRVRRLIHQSQLYQQLEAANRMLQHLASVDSLTQVANRRQFDDHLHQEWERMSREQSSLSIILCDIDFFKLYNDAKGHQAGDNCLMHIAKAIAAAVSRPNDLAARYGGEEFVAILPNTNVSEAICVANNIRAGIAALKLPHPNSKISSYITLSMGIAAVSLACDPGLLPENLVAAADQALYEAKAQGRDRYCIHLMTQ
jgi:diguanylate cyclase (GGDEF)-like protein